MQKQHIIKKPVFRNKFRKFFGKEYFILKRKLKWIFDKEKYAVVNQKTNFTNCLIQHKSFLLRPLKDVDMYLQHNKVMNLQLAIQKINHVVINPGEVFSVWKLVGRPTKSKGYLEGLVLSNGKIDKGTGGGLCQLGNLLFWMALHTPLTVKERWRHGFGVFPDVNRNIPFGCGATLSYNYIDLQLKNETNKIFQIQLWLDDEYLNGKITCNQTLHLNYTVVEKEHAIKQQWWGAYTRHNQIWKQITNTENNNVDEELVCENNSIMMYNPLLDK